ncbi:hypothetical protein ETTORE_0156 [Pseudomonas phage Ettore]|nr:hypothetical protein ETTORE_0156 [Pseudomonas phage Ettore]
MIFKNTFRNIKLKIQIAILNSEASFTGSY